MPSGPNLSVAGRGNVRYSANVGGAPEADAAFNAFPKPEGWQRDLKAICEARKQSLAANIDRLEQQINAGASRNYAPSTACRCAMR